MSRNNRWIMVTLLTVGMLGVSTPVMAGKSVGVDKATKTRIRKDYGKLPLAFIQNDGQVDKRVKFYEKGAGHTTFFTEEGVCLSLFGSQKEEGSRVDQAKRIQQNTKSAIIKLLLLGANKNPEIIAEGMQKGKINYFIGNDPNKWRTNIPTYRAVRYKDVYDGIDIMFYGNNRQLEYDIIVKPDADPLQVLLSYEGIENLQIAENGDLDIILESGRLTQKKPYIYQEIDGKRIILEGKFKILNPQSANNHRSRGFRPVRNHEPEGSTPAISDSKPETRITYGFEVVSYNKNYPLIIDPILVYSTYLGGSSYDSSRGIAVDAAGAIYVTGYTSSIDFPTTNPIQEGSNAGFDDAFVTKIDASGSILVYSTYLGGSSSDFGRSIAVDAAGAAYVTGITGSSDFPTTNPIQGSYAGSLDAFITKIDATGSALVYSTYLGGSANDYGRGVAVDTTGAAYVIGYTSSIDFPTSNPIQWSHAGGWSDAFVTKIDATGSALAYSTYLGGNSDERGYSIAVDTAGSAYVTGYTSSIDFPTVSPLQGSNAGGRDVFVTKIDPTGYIFAYSTYLGGSDDDHGWDIAIDTAGAIYVTGIVESGDFPTTNPIQGSNAGFDDAFVTKIDASGSILAYSTYLGGSDNEGGTGIAVDAAGAAYVTGGTFSGDFPTTNPIQGSNAGFDDAFVTKIDASGSILVYSTYLGGSDGEGGTGIAVDAAGAAYITGLTSSTDFPTASPLQGSYAGSYDVFVTKIGEEGGSVCHPGSTQSCYTGQAGICAAGTKTCDTNGSWSVCVQNNQAGTEICDGMDNDCDGGVDEGCYHPLDVNRDGSVTPADALCVFQYYLELTSCWSD